MLSLLLLSVAAAGETRVAVAPEDWGARLTWSGDRLALATSDGAVHVWDASGEALISWEVDRWRVQSLSMSADGRRLLTLDSRGHAELWDTDTGARLARHEGDGGWGLSAAVLAPDGQRALLADGWGVSVVPVDGGLDRPLPGAQPANGDQMGFVGELVYTPAPEGGARLWHADGRPAGDRIPTAGAVGRLFPAGEDLLHVSWTGAMSLLDPEGGAATPLEVPALADDVWALDPQGRLLAFALPSAEGGDVAVAFWDLAEGRHLPGLALPPAGAQAMAFSPDGRRLALLSGATLRLVDVPLPDAAPAPPPGLTPLSIALSGDGRRALALYPDGGLWAWWLDGGELAWRRQLPLGRAPHSAPLAALSPDGARVAWVDGGGALRLAPVEGGEGRVLMPQTRDLQRLVWGPDGALAVLAYHEVLSFDPEGRFLGRVKAADVKALAPGPGGERLSLATWSGDLIELAADGAPLRAQSLGDPPGALHALPDGRLLIVDASGGLRLLDAEGQPVDVKLPIMVGATAMEEVTTTALSPDGQAVLLSGEEGDLLLRHLPDMSWLGEVVHAWPWEYTLGYPLVAAHPDGRRVLSADRHGAVQLWEPGAEGGPLLRTFGAPRPAALAVAADAERLFVARGEGLVEVLDWSGARLMAMDFDAEVMDLALSPDGLRLAVALSDGGVLSLPSAGGEPHWELALFQWVAREVAFSPDGQRLAARDDVGNVALLEAASGEVAPGYTPPRGATAMGFDAEGRLVVFEDGRGLATLDGEAWSTRGLSRQQRWETDGAMGACEGVVHLNASGWSRRGVPAVYRTREGTRGRLAGSALTGLPSDRLACGGGRVALSTMGGDVFVLDGVEGALERVLPGDGAALADLLVLPDGRVVTASLAGRVQVWGPGADSPSIFVLRDPTHAPAPEALPPAPDPQDPGAPAPPPLELP